MNNYYFTTDKWYGPVPNSLDDRYYISEEMLQYHNYPSGPIAPELSKWAGQVKELNKDFLFEEQCSRSTRFDCDCFDKCFFPAANAIPITGPFDDLDEELLCKPMPTQTEWDKDQQKQMITEIMDADQKDGLYTDTDLISINPDYKEEERQTFGEYMAEARGEFVNIILKHFPHEQNPKHASSANTWTEIRVASENMLIAFDQLLTEYLKTKP